jgi:hypothetical protein
MNEEEKLKKLESENYRLLEVAKLTRDDVRALEKQNKELKTITEAARTKIDVLEQKCAEQENKIAGLENIQAETKKALFENEKVRINKDLEAKAAEEARLLEKIQALEMKCAQKEAEIKTVGEALAQQAEMHRLALKAKEESATQQVEKYRLAIEES